MFCHRFDAYEVTVMSQKKKKGKKMVFILVDIGRRTKTFTYVTNKAINRTLKEVGR